MVDKTTRKRLKNIKKEIKKLRDEYRYIEFRPCQNDEDLKIKDEDLKKVMEEIYALEKEQDKLYWTRLNKQ